MGEQRDGEGLVGAHAELGGDTDGGELERAEVARAGGDDRGERDAAR